MARRKLTAGNSIGDGSLYQTAIVQPGANTLVLLFVANTRPGNPGGLAIAPTVSGNGLTWTVVRTVTTGGGDNRRLTCFRAMAPAPSAGQVLIDFGGQTQDLCAWSVFEYDDVDTTGADGATAVAQSNTATTTATALTASLAPSADPLRNFTVGGIMLDLFNDPLRPVTPGVGFTEIDEQTPNQFLGKGATLQTQDSATALSGVGWTWNAAENAAAVVLEVKVAPLSVITPESPVDPTEALIRRFEPVLFCHPDEPFFPVDAKRFVEHAALWSSQSAFDDKENWGGNPGDPFPRAPLAGPGLAATDGEPGARLSTPSFLLDGERDQRFLELGGWKDKNGQHEPDVTTSSADVYADRNEIAARYSADLELAASRFWYHAEVFDPDRLVRLAARVNAPDLGKVLARFKNPILLCYYLFFPAHEQSLNVVSCQNVEATEALCRAGDWQCIAILLDGDGKLPSAMPRFFGHTGARPSPVLINGTWTYRPYEFDADGLTVMKVEGWRPETGMTAGQPEVVGEHPRLYVARGSHGLYTTPGSHILEPFQNGERPTHCGLYDTASVTPDADSDFAEDAGAFIAKIVAGWSLGPWGLVAGVVSAAVEGLIPEPSGFDGVATGDGAEPDVAPAAGDGKTIRPAGLAIADGGGDVHDWAARQNLSVNGRRYDFIVDRATQVWWPSDGGETGFRGRWGQQVTSDPLGRRSGPRFPDYVTMFLKALAAGDAAGQLDLSR
ncbi:hypothetical protein TUM20985_19090 [Mycobacterium antarcticum]|uniref:hypothetical protein n=1 Tax=Mycolicibacterium sp. TUM20985 TaxID=3023370 RepID=UPI0025729E94|nr:hypothetical protein [Mycolicibacterium sp. TUM20985]BDX31362.1 hypothetical protein TUM20985_19090 [Mycolicibacterium sp. TUM20985]